jgi:hypothetical protein
MHGDETRVSEMQPVRARARGGWFHVILVALAMASVTSAAAVQAAVVTVQTDTSWRVIGTTPAAGWNTSLAFDDSAWLAAQVDYPASALGTHTVDFIWDSTSPTGGSFPDIWVRKRFTLPGAALSAILDAAADDDVQLWVNGTLVINNADCLASEILGTNVQPYLVPGDNLIAARVTDCGAPHGFGMFMDVTAKDAPIPIPAFGLPGLAALASALALGGVLLLVRRAQT